MNPFNSGWMRLKLNKAGQGRCVERKTRASLGSLSATLLPCPSLLGEIASRREHCTTSPPHAGPRLRHGTRFLEQQQKHTHIWGSLLTRVAVMGDMTNNRGVGFWREWEMIFFPLSFPLHTPRRSEEWSIDICVGAVLFHVLSSWLQSCGAGVMPWTIPTLSSNAEVDFPS